MDLVEELNKLQRQLDDAVKRLPLTGKDYAQAYGEYRIALAQELVKLRDKGTPVSICSDLARGNKDVATKKFKEISTEAIYRANLESINSIKIQMKVLENQIEREWNNGNTM